MSLTLLEQIDVANKRLKASFPSVETSITFKVINRLDKFKQPATAYGFVVTQQYLSDPQMGKDLTRCINKIMHRSGITTVQQYIDLKAAQ
ncbi:hypothetical protein [Methylophaga sp.]|uniref:hypothetical protein n=1 Tax=Methylophaga sp. TaxID=2024840 RepID=UPI003A929AC5